MDESASGRLKKMGHQPKKEELPEGEENPKDDPAVEKTQAIHVKEKLRLARKPTQIDIQIDEDIESITCPKCETKLEPGAIICIDCSYNVQTGKEITTKVKRKSRNPYSAPSSSNDEETPYFDSVGISRGAYWGYSILLGIISNTTYILLFGAGAFNGQAQLGESQSSGFIGLQLFFGIISIFIIVKRLKNLGSSGWMCLLLIVPFVNLWIAYRLSICPPGYAIHKQLDDTGRRLRFIFIYIPLILLTLLFAVIFFLSAS